MAVRQIPNLTPVVFLSPTAQLEVVQDGTTYRTSAAQIADLAKGSMLSRINLVNDVVTNAQWFPLFADVNSGDTSTLYTSDPNYNYLPLEGRLSSMRVEATQGIVYNASAIPLDYTFPTNDNATSCGPLTLTATITVPTGSEWMIL